jgi:hypothetical protein
MPADIDPKLREQLQRAGDGGSVKAIVALDMSGAATASSAHSQKELLDRVSKEVGETPHEVTSLANLGVVIVRGSGRYVRHLLAQDQVLSATASGAEDAGDG